MLVLGGPTASGKTAFAIAVAERYDAEIVGADSRQVYRGMPVGTAAPTQAEQARVAHHLIGFLDPCQEYSAARFVIDAAAAIDTIRARGKRVIVAGGTGFYLRALCGEVALGAEPDAAIRTRVLREARVHPVEVLHDWLRARDPVRAMAVSAGDPYRIGRALEGALVREAGAGPSPRRLPTLRARSIPYVKLALQVEPELLAARIDARTDAMLAGGLLEEAERIGAAARAADAVGYGVALAYRAGWLTFAELRRVLARSTRRYAKRQGTWFRAQPDLTWIDPLDGAAVAQAGAAIGW